MRSGRVLGAAQAPWPTHQGETPCPLRGTPRLGGADSHPRPPRFRKRRFSGGTPGMPQKGHFRPFSGKTPKIGDFGLPGPRALPDPGGYRGAPARGVDVKPPSGRGPGPGPGVPRGLLAGQDPSRGPETSRRGLRGPSRGLGAPSRAPGARVLHQPLAPGPRGSGGPGTGVPGPPRGPGKPLRRGRGAPVPDL